MFIIMKSKWSLWTVGHNELGPWEPIKDFSTLEAAEEHCAYLNGSQRSADKIITEISLLRAQIEDVIKILDNLQKQIKRR